LRPTLDSFRLLLIFLDGWLNQLQQEVIDYLQEETRVLREQLGARRLRLNHDQRRRLAVKAQKLGRRVLHELATLVTPETVLALHRKLIARKYARLSSWTFRVTGTAKLTSRPRNERTHFQVPHLQRLALSGGRRPPAAT